MSNLSPRRCLRSTRYPTKDLARAAVKRRQAAEGHRLTVVGCEFCQGYHLRRSRGARR